jgi:hypothetical protein
VTPGELITAIITERGIARPAYRETLPRLFGEDPSGPARVRLPQASSSEGSAGKPILTVI